MNSKFLVDKMCDNMNEDFGCIDDKFIVEFKDKIRTKLFSSLVKMVKNIEEKILGLIDGFVQKEKNNLNIVKNNLISFKKICSEGLDELKDKISFEDMMLDENIFLLFDQKFQGANFEKDKIYKDIEKYKVFKNELNILEKAVEKIYNEIYAFLDKYSTNDIYENISKEINNNEIIFSLIIDLSFNKYIKRFKHDELRKLFDMSKIYDLKYLYNILINIPYEINEKEKKIILGNGKEIKLTGEFCDR